jgi:dipeptidyl aminopeptidase/acylaminoacyl peptidase
LTPVDYKSSPIAKKILKKGVLRKGFEYVDHVDIHKMVYKSDELMVTGFVVKPKKKGKYPCIIYNRGGNRDMGSLYVATAAIYMGKIAAGGYIVIASNYRGNSNSEGKEEFGGSDVRDVLNLIPALSQIVEADTSRIGMFGISRGGMMAYMAAKNNPQIKAVAVVGGMSNLFTMKEKRPDMESHVYASLIPNYANDSKNQLEKRSVAFWTNELPKSTKFLMLHGTQDQKVSIDEPRELHAKFIENGIKHVFVQYEGDNHGITKHSTHASDQIINWFDKYVKNGIAFEEDKKRFTIH